MSNWKIHLNKYYWLAYLPSGTAFLCAWQGKWVPAGICLMFALWLAEKSGMHIANQLCVKGNHERARAHGGSGEL